MFKRFQVMDLFHGNDPIDDGEWIKEEDRLPKGENGRYKVKLSDGKEMAAYFFRDQIIPLMHGKKSSYWWCQTERVPLHNVIEWKDKKGEA